MPSAAPLQTDFYHLARTTHARAAIKSVSPQYRRHEFRGCKAYDDFVARAAALCKQDGSCGDHFEGLALAAYEGDATPLSQKKQSRGIPELKEVQSLACVHLRLRAVRKRLASACEHMSQDAGLSPMSLSR